MLDLRYGHDCLTSLRAMPDRSVQCCVTSPPYFGLRDYGTGTWVNGSPTCDHKGKPFRIKDRINEHCGTGNDVKNAADTEPMRGSCSKCGAIRIDKQIGLESTLDEFIAKLVAVFREVRRVLHPSGTLWCNMGDSYAGSWGNYGGQNRGKGKQREIGNGSQVPNPAYEGQEDRRPATASQPGIKPKELMMVPYRLALAMSADGWTHRDTVIWHKPAPMPESVRDRCTKAWEPIFMFVKSVKYFADMEAVRHGSNLRNVWTMSAEPYAAAHFATYPSELPRRCIRIGTSIKGCCPTCRAPWVRVTARKGVKRHRPNDLTKRDGADGTGNHCGNTVAGVSVDTLGWQPSCKHQHTEADAMPCLVLDPFSGSGTTGQVAQQLGQDYIGIDLNPAYLPLAQERIGGLFLKGA